MIDLLLFFYLLFAFPSYLFRGKRKAFFKKLSLPKVERKPLIWIHAVSVGEVKAAKPLFDALKLRYPHFSFFITTTTETGQAEAKRSLPTATSYALLPFDFSFLTKAWVRRLNPTLFLLIESDIWPNLLYALQKHNAKTILVSGKLSARSAKRFARVPKLSRRLFARFNLILAQNEEHRARFAPLVPPHIPLLITGNLKLDLKREPVDLTSYLLPPKPTLAITCTHPGEEALLLTALEGLDFRIFLAPRHPHRIQEVANLLTSRNLPFTLFSEKRGGEGVILVDTMGQLPICYSLSTLAILGGSFVPEIGGHNPLEPCLYQIPVLFGPHMHTQEELAHRVLTAQAGQQVTLANLRTTVQTLLANPPSQDTFSRLFSQSESATEKALAQIIPFI